MSATLAELEARVAALEADRADYKAVLTAVNVLGQQTRERLDLMDSRIDGVENRLGSRIDRLGSEVGGLGSRMRSLEEGVSEVKDLLIRALDR